MKTIHKLAALISLSLAGTAAIAADWSSSSIGYRYAPSQSEPGVSDKVSKNILTFTHVSGDKLGTNFFTIDLLKSNSVDPARGGGGAQEWYGFYQRDFSLKALTGNTTGYGFAKDIKLVARGDAGTKGVSRQQPGCAEQAGCRHDGLQQHAGVGDGLEKIRHQNRC